MKAAMTIRASGIASSQLRRSQAGGPSQLSLTFRLGTEIVIDPLAELEVFLDRSVQRSSSRGDQGVLVLEMPAHRGNDLTLSSFGSSMA
jgi:hypothetical protein